MPKCDWTLEEARAWVDEHKKASDGPPIHADELRHLAEKSSKGFPQQFEVKQLGPEQLYIEGYASTKDLDRGGDVVDPHAFDETMAGYIKNPIVLYMHGWWDFPVGKVVDHRIDEKGLWVKVFVSATAYEIRQLITEGILKAFSIGYNPTLIERVNPGTPQEYRLIRKLILYEISIVNIPMNAEALMELAEAKGLNIKRFNLEGAKAPEEGKMDPEQIKKIVAEVMAGQLADLKKTITPDAALKTIADLQEAIKGVATKAEFDAFVEKYKTVAAEAVAALEKRITQKWDETALAATHVFVPANTIEQAKKFGFLTGLQGPDGKPSAEGYKSLLLSDKPDIVARHIGMSDRKEMVEEFQRISDDLMIAGAIKGFVVNDRSGGVNWQGNPAKALPRLVGLYKRMLAEFSKALDTQTDAEGYDWLPTVMSANLIESLEAERGVVRRIPRVAMPSSPWKWPILSSKPVAYKKSEAISDANVQTIILSTMGTADLTFTAKGMGVGSIVSSEINEDSIVAVLPTLRQKMVQAAISGEEYAIINGDDSTTHQDTDIAAESAVHIGKLFKGLRYMALNATTTSKKDWSGTHTYDLYVDTLAVAGKYAINRPKGFFIVSYNSWFKMLKLTEFKSQDVFGQLAANITGGITRALGHDIVPSEHMRSDLAATGVDAGAGDDVHSANLYLDPDSFLIGDRRLFTVESDKNILTDQIVVVGTERIDFKEMAPSADTPVVCGFNIVT